jgi:hypothetical protein
MPYNSNIVTSLHGRRIGLQSMSSGQTGAGLAGRKAEFLVGPDGMRHGVTTAETTGTTVPAYGVSFLNGTSAASSSVYVLDPPIPGVLKTVVFSSANTPQYLRTANAETFRTSADSTVATVISSTLTGAVVQLIGLTTGMWGLLTNGTTVISRAATTYWNR